ncbi:MAG TPA: hypothetical protein VNT30_09420 [Stellaceae bacterium]|nr:hypothetical protein [Stellaceae bacterium]
MTVSSTLSQEQWTGNGTTALFGFFYPYVEAADLVVSLFDTSALTYLAAPVLNGGGTYDYTLNSTVDPATGYASLGGEVIFNNPPQGNHRITVQRLVTPTQGVHLLDNSKLPAAVIEAALDRAAMVAQQLTTGLAQALQFPPVDNGSYTPVLPAAAARAGRLLGFDSNGALTVTTLSSSIDTTLAYVQSTLALAQAAQAAATAAVTSSATSATAAASSATLAAASQTQANAAGVQASGIALSATTLLGTITSQAEAVVQTLLSTITAAAIQAAQTASAAASLLIGLLTPPPNTLAFNYFVAIATTPKDMGDCAMLTGFSNENYAATRVDLAQGTGLILDLGSIP